MLYVTTRNNLETYTAHRALTENRGPDGGFYVPFRLPQFDKAQIESLVKRPFSQCVADTLNLFFSCRLTAFDVDFCIGRCPVRLVMMSHRIMLGETWHNLQWDFDRMIKQLYAKVTGQEEAVPTDWFRIALRIGVLFGFFGKLMRKEIGSVRSSVDLAVLSGDFSAPMAAWYARNMGLPIGNIICCCNENNGPWELLHHGEIRTNNVAMETATPDGDYAVPPDLERFVHGCGGHREALRFLECCRLGRMYIPSDLAYEQMQKGMYVSVIGQVRGTSAIPNIYRTHDQILDPYGALIYSGLLDYRAKTGESRGALILCEKGAAGNPELVAAAMGITVSELGKKLDMT